MAKLAQTLPVDPAHDWEVVAAELCAVREQIKSLQHREDDLVSVFRGFGAGVYAGKQHKDTE